MLVSRIVKFEVLITIYLPSTESDYGHIVARGQLDGRRRRRCSLADQGHGQTAEIHENRMPAVEILFCDDIFLINTTVM